MKIEELRELSRANIATKNEYISELVEDIINNQCLPMARRGHGSCRVVLDSWRSRELVGDAFKALKASGFSCDVILRDHDQRYVFTLTWLEE